MHGDCIEAMRGMAEASVDAIVCDPPAGIGFMGRGWDGNRGGRDQWIDWLAEVMAEALRVLKPGAHALVWALPRTSHWTGMALEDAGFDVRDRITHLFGSGFPKSLSLAVAIDKANGALEDRGIGFTTAGYTKSATVPGGAHGPHEGITESAREWQGWGTALKPGGEDWWLCRKPLAEGTVASNVLAWGTGGINVDACRIESALPVQAAAGSPGFGANRDDGYVLGTGAQHHAAGRWPANVCLDEEAAALLDEQAGVRPASFRKARTTDPAGATWALGRVDEQPFGYHDAGNVSRFFYTAKSSRSERGKGCTHPTVKPVALMRWLCRLITPPGGLILDPFVGSGSTGVAAIAEGFRFVGVEREAEYCEMARERLAGVHPRLPGLDLP